jgi:hypothetical protein
MSDCEELLSVSSALAFLRLRGPARGSGLLSLSSEKVEVRGCVGRRVSSGKLQARLSAGRMSTDISEEENEETRLLFRRLRRDSNLTVPRRACATVFGLTTGEDSCKKNETSRRGAW